MNVPNQIKQMLPEPLKVFLRAGRRAAIKMAIVVETPTYRYACPVCQQRVKAFCAISDYFCTHLERHGYPYPPDSGETCNRLAYSCPRCGASDRDRLYAIYVNRILESYPISARVSLLDIAPSTPLRSYLQSLPKIVYRSADLNRQDVDDVVDIMNMSCYENNRFDAFICSHVLEHVTDDRKALAELYRVLRPGGWGILMVPINLTITDIDEDPTVTDEGERWRRFGQYDHVREYSKQGFIDRVVDARFSVNQYGVGYFGDLIFQKHGISPTSILYVVGKL